MFSNSISSSLADFRMPGLTTTTSHQWHRWPFPTFSRVYRIRVRAYTCECMVRQVCVCARAPPPNLRIILFSRALAPPERTVFHTYLHRGHVNAEHWCRACTTGRTTRRWILSWNSADSRPPLDALIIAQYANGGGQVNAFGKDVRTYLPTNRHYYVMMINNDE